MGEAGAEAEAGRVAGGARTQIKLGGKWGWHANNNILHTLN